MNKRKSETPKSFFSLFLAIALLILFSCGGDDDDDNYLEVSDDAELVQFSARVNGTEFDVDLNSDENFIRWKKGSDFTIKVKNNADAFVELFNVGDLLGDHMASGNINLGVDDGCIAYYEQSQTGIRYDCKSSGAETNVIVLEKTEFSLKGTFNGTLVGAKLYDEIGVTGTFEIRALQ